jgi:hypothetical protein
MKNYESLSTALDDLRKRGYENNFATDTFCLYCGDQDIRLDPEEFHIDEVYRFGSQPNPENSFIIYAITSLSGVKGTLVATDETYTGSLNLEMAKKLRDHSALTG